MKNLDCKIIKYVAVIIFWVFFVFFFHIISYSYIPYQDPGKNTPAFLKFSRRQIYSRLSFQISKFFTVDIRDSKKAETAPWEIGK